jgi:hypothetical protein
MAHYEVIDFLAVQIALRDQWRTHPGGVLRAAPAFCAALYGLVRPRETPLPFGALTLSRPRLSLEATEALRALFLADLLARPVDNERHTGKLVDRVGKEHVVFDIDGTREAARQRALPKTEELPPPQRRLNQVCAPGYTGRKRGEVVRTRTVVSQAHSYQWLGSFGNKGNGRYREELRRGLTAIRG